MSAPKRIQISRQHPWQTEPKAIKVSRPGKWGKPFAAKIKHGEVGLATMTRQMLVDDFREWLLTPVTDWPNRSASASGDTGRTSLMGVPFQGRPTIEEIRAALAGKDLACWCPTSQPCHADVLLELANGVTL